MSRVDSFILLTLVFCSLMLGVYATRRSLQVLTGDVMASRWWALLVIFMSYFHYLLDFGHPCCAPFRLPYDLPSMALFAICIYCLIAARMPLFYLFFAIATLNRESAIFLIPLLVLYRSVGMRNIRSPGLPRLAGHVLLLCMVWWSLRMFTHHLYTPPLLRVPHAGSFELHLSDNIGYLLRPYYWASYASIFGFTWLFTYTHWLEIPHAGIRRALWIGPVAVACLYVVGIFSEIRIFGELISLYVIAFALLLPALLRQEARLPGHEPAEANL